jgi:deazaflavin-dependent oxidoreductase (nitroreductase family)
MAMWYNGPVAWLLRSPLHGLASKNMMLLTYQGRKSGKTYSVPVNYVRDTDGFSVTSLRSRTWWRNLRGGAPVRVRWQGQELEVSARAIEDPEAVTAALAAYLKQVPGYARYFGVGLGTNGEPDAADVARAAQERVMIRIEAV